MADFDDIRLDRRTEPPTPPPRVPTWPLIAAGLLVGALAAIWWFGYPKQPEKAAASVAVKETTVETRPGRGQAEPGEPIDLPPLDQSDALIRTLVSRLSSHPQVAAWLATDNLLRNLAVVIENVASGQSPAKQLRAVRPVGAFVARASAGEFVIDPASYRRYDNLTAAVEGIDARGAARFYATVKPRLDEAYQELGSEDNLDRAVEHAIVALLQTPVVDGDIRVRPVSVSYAYADPRLESLTKAQRQFLRMGPRNMRIVKAKLRDVAGYLGIPETSLPARDGR